MKGRFFLWLTLSLIFFLIPLSAALWGNPRRETVSAEITVFDADSKSLFTLPLDEYLKGVVAAEMPASFEKEALKAQAVAARTYSVNRLLKEFPAEHPDAAVCTSSTHCKAYKTEEQAKKDWGEAGDEYWNKISSCVDSTHGEIIVYENSPIDAVFHAASSGRTANSEDVWSSSVPYLRSVESPGEDAARDYITTVSVPFSEFCEKLKTIRPGISVTDRAQIGMPVAGEGGYVKYADIGGEQIRGTELRSLFGLRSTAFTISVGEEITFHVTGYGHGVGLSQYGANAMAKQGKNYQEILSTYYTGTMVEKR